MRIPFALAGLMAAVTTLAATGQAMAQDFKPRIVRFGYGLVDESNQAARRASLPRRSRRPRAAR